MYKHQSWVQAPNQASSTSTIRCASTLYQPRAKILLNHLSTIKHFKAPQHKTVVCVQQTVAQQPLKARLLQFYE